ncbi:enoyl-CoA hydratase-related protein [Streptomyces sp. NPDC058701]|uniref:enoyl-CoA hydratase-related protein n=1 Tax=Streptomyces sp. NPDC058701 TaxID=3346608 RepID=UPI0036498CCC
MASPIESDSLLLERRDDVLIITLNRPRVRNALDVPTARALDGALTELCRDPALRAGVLTGAGGHFCSGMDLKKFPVHGVPAVDGRGLGGLTRAQLTKPLIAAVEGAAVGGGMELALSCDLIVAGASALFALPEVTRGLIAAESGAVRLPARYPYHLAMEMLLTGDPVTAASAARHGLVNRITEDGGALSAALELASRVTRHPEEAVRAARAVARTADEVGPAAAWRLAPPGRCQPVLLLHARLIPPAPGPLRPYPAQWSFVCGRLLRPCSAGRRPCPTR